MVLDPADPDSAYVIPLSSDEDRVTPGGRVRVYETRDAGAGWAERGEGLPQADAYLTILRLAFDQARRGLGARALLRRDVGRRLRLGRRRSELVHRRDAPAARLLGHSRGLSQLHQVGERPPVAGGCLGAEPVFEVVDRELRSTGSVRKVQIDLAPANVEPVRW